MQTILFWGGAFAMFTSGLLWLSAQVTVHVASEVSDDAKLDAYEAALEPHVRNAFHEDRVTLEPIDEPTPELAPPLEPDFYEFEKDAEPVKPSTTGWR